MSEPNWPEWVKSGTWLYWSDYENSYVLCHDEPMQFGLSLESECYAFIFRRCACVIDHDWQIPDEPDPLRRKWRKQTRITEPEEQE